MSTNSRAKGRSSPAKGQARHPRPNVHSKSRRFCLSIRCRLSAGGAGYNQPTNPVFLRRSLKVHAASLGWAGATQRYNKPSSEELPSARVAVRSDWDAYQPVYSILLASAREIGVDSVRIGLYSKKLFVRKSEKFVVTQSSRRGFFVIDTAFVIVM